jgi:hypothetical protein
VTYHPAGLNPTDAMAVALFALTILVLVYVVGLRRQH